MLFGSEKIQNKLLAIAKSYEKEKKIRIIYGAMVGSISKGIQYIDSDYDTRFLYINDDFPNKIYHADKLTEEKVITRKYLPETSYEKLPCWEITSFLHYLVNPMIDGKFSTGLYNVVGWTFGSPYAWDPYGLQQKIMPIIQKSFKADYLLSFYKEHIAIDKMDNKTLAAKDYLDEIYSALAIQWIKEFNEFPPVSLNTLLVIAPQDIREKVEIIVQDSKNKARMFDMDNNIHQTGKYTFAARDKSIDDYIIESINYTEKTNMNIYSNECNSEKLVNYMYRIIGYSLFNEETIKEVIG